MRPMRNVRGKIRFLTCVIRFEIKPLRLRQSFSAGAKSQRRKEDFQHIQCLKIL